MSAKKNYGVLFLASMFLAVLGSIAFLASPASATTLTLASGQPTTFNGQPDPNTTVSPGGSGGHAVITSTQPLINGYATISGARWISTSASGSTSTPGTYTYKRAFDLPTCVKTASLSVQVLADDKATVKLNGGVIGTNAGFFASSTFNGTAVGGPNLLEFLVTDTIVFSSGLDYKATINYDECEKGIVKVCKVAGPGIALNQPFTFTAGGQSVVVPAGPAAQGGFCKPFPAGFTFGPLTIQEALLGLVQVDGPIQVAPPNRLVSQNPATATVIVDVGPGVTEVTFTDRGPGYMEICKETQPTNTSTQFTFNIHPPVGPDQTVTIPGGGACSGPLQVASGAVSVTEVVPFGWQMTNQCHTLPVANPSLLLSCDHVNHVATATVLGGDITTQTLLYFRNCAFHSCFKQPGDVGVPIDPSGIGAGMAGSSADEIVASIQAAAAQAQAALIEASTPSVAPEDRAAERAQRTADRQAALPERRADRAQRGGDS